MAATPGPYPEQVGADSQQSLVSAESYSQSPQAGATPFPSPVASLDVTQQDDSNVQSQLIKDYQP